MSAKLTELQRRFADELLVDPLDAAAAYVRAGGKQKAAKQNAYHALHKPQVKAYLAERRAAITAKVGLKQERVITELAELLDVDLADVMPWDEQGGTLRPASQLTKAQRKAVRKLKVTKTRYTQKDGTTVETTTTEVQMVSREKLLELAGRATGTFAYEDEADKPRDTVYVVVMPPQAKDAAEWVKTYNIQQ